MNRSQQPGVFRAILSRDRSTWRAFVLFAVIAALLGVATAAVSPAHLHPKTTAGCDVCLTAGLAASAQVAQVHSLTAPQIRSLGAVAVTASHYSLLRFHASHTRGPPAAL